MRTPRTYTALEDFGRVRLSKYFFMRNFLYSEIGNFYGRPNLPENPDLAIEAGRKLATECLDPLVETFGPIHIRSGYRSPDLNTFGAKQKPQKMAATPKNYAHHIWDVPDKEGRIGACVTVVIPWFADRYAEGRDWRHLAWWLFDHIDFQELYFFPKLAAFNLTWREMPERRILSYIRPKGLLRDRQETPRMPPEQRLRLYEDFPRFRGLELP